MEADAFRVRAESGARGAVDNLEYSRCEELKQTYIVSALLFPVLLEYLGMFIEGEVIAMPKSIIFV